ncbi:hypothetical protein ACFL2I_03835 [Candidatus Omnitrophota bacterium]
MIEKTIFITKISNLKFVNSRYKRLYFGNEFCEKLIPQLNELKKAIRYCERNKLKFSLVTPYVTNRGIDNLDKLFLWLQNNKMNCEIIINDYGVLDLINEEYQTLQPVLGRLLTKQKRDPRITNLTEVKPRKHKFFKMDGEYFIVLAKKAPDALASFFKDSNVNVPIIQSFVRSYGIARVEIDNLLQGINLRIPRDSLSVSLYVPYGYITTTRLCTADPFRNIEKFSCRISSCGKQCQRYIIELRNKDMPKRIYKKGNTLFFKNRKVSSHRELIKIGINRLVYQPEIPV